MNQKSLFAIISVFAIAGTLSSQETIVFSKQQSSLDKKGELTTTNPSLRSALVFQENGGVQNGCFKASRGQELKSSVVVTFTNPFSMNIENTSAPLSFKVKVKGKGQLRICFLIYDKNKKYISQHDKKEILDTNGEWKQLEFVYTPQASNAKYLANAAFASSALIIDDGEFLIDDWDAEVKNPLAKITLEE